MNKLLPAALLSLLSTPQSKRTKPRYTKRTNPLPPNGKRTTLKKLLAEG